MELAKCRLAMLVNNFDVGGLENLVISLLDHLDQSRFELYLICLNGGGKQYDKIKLPEDKCLILTKRQLNFAFSSVDINSILEIRKFIRKHRIDIIHAHNAAPLIYSGVASLFMMKRPVLLYTEHNQIYSATGFSRKKFKLYLRFADHIVAISENLKKSLKEDFSASAPMTLIYNGIDGQRFSTSVAKDVRAELGVDKNIFLFGCGVVLSKQKGMPYLFEAISGIKDKLQDCLFVIAGDGPLKGELEDLSRTLKIDHLVRLIGYRSDMPDVVSSLNAYVLPSLWEGLPLSLIEALALSKPVVCTSVGGNPEIIEDKVNGLVVPPADPDALGRALLEMLQSKTMYKEMTAVNRQKFDDQFSLTSMVSVHEDLYKKLIMGQ